MSVQQASTMNPVTDSTRSALDFIHGLLIFPPGEQPSLETLLRQLAQAFTASGAGIAAHTGGGPTPRCRVGSENVPLPWELNPSLADHLTPGSPGITSALAEGGSQLAVAVAGGTFGGLLWLDDAKRSAWTPGEAAALALAGQVIGRWLTPSESTAAPRWAQQLDRMARQQCMESAALVTRRLAHDFGNILTGILGFSELSLAQQVPANTPLHTYLIEVHRAAQNGAQFTNQLRLFSRRQAAASSSTPLAGFLANEEKRLRSSYGHGITLEVEASPDLPSVAIETEALRQVFEALLDNSKEAIHGSGAGHITISARPFELSAADCQDYQGDLRPGRHVELRIADNGPGLASEVERRLFAEPFYSSKPRRRGFGLSLAHGVMTAHRGGIRLSRGESRGAVVQLVLPVATVIPTPAIATSPAPRGDRVLVVDDDPLILQFVCTTLERAGYRVQPAANAEEAFRSYTTAAPDPFRLVLSDVIMPQTSGVDLARRLVARDANVRMLFMSGQVSSDFVASDVANFNFDLLPKPFRPDGLLKAVRHALEHGNPRRGNRPSSVQPIAIPGI